MHSENTPLFYWHRPTLLIVLCSALLALTPADASAQQEPPGAASATAKTSTEDEAPHLQVLYSGQLQDSDGQPISGVFRLTFKVYTHQLGAKPIWQEQHFVAVLDGRYRLELGTRLALTPNELEGNRWMGVELANEGEILRDRLIVSIADSSLPEGTRPTASTAGRNTTFAEVAERANYAEHAAIADKAKKVGDLDAEAVEKLSNLALERLGEHISDPDAHKGGKKSGVSTERQLVDKPIGGRGGSPYKLHCPPGFVVTGLEGRAGRMIDSIQVVCSPIQ